MFLLGRQAMLWHEPPMYLRSIKATRFPCPAVVHAATFAPVPLPSTSRSYSSVFAVMYPHQRICGCRASRGNTEELARNLRNWRLILFHLPACYNLMNPRLVGRHVTKSRATNRISCWV